MAGNPFDRGSGTAASNPFQSSPPVNQFGGPGTDPQTQALINIAHQRGGSVAEAVDELVHPQTSILSTIGDGFKNAFKGFVDTISIPSNVVAGMISPDKTISEAVNEHLRVSDVIFGEQDKNATTLQKVGGFVVRTAVDILTDPLTYVTFGTGSAALFGARAATKLSLADDTIGVLNKAGDASLDYLKLVERQQKGLESALALGGNAAAKSLPDRLKTFKELRALEDSGKVAKEVIEASKDELDAYKKLLKQTVDAPLDKEFAKAALSNVLKAHPALAETLLDKGGIKLFGKSILSGQRIQSVTAMIPGMTLLDNATQQSRLAIGALFDPSIHKGADGAYVRMPPEFMDFQRKAQDMAGYLKDERVLKMQDIIKANKLTREEGEFFTASIEAGKIPADPRLAKAYKQLTGFNEEELQILREKGIRISRLDKHVPHVLVSSGIKVLPFKMPPSAKVGAALERTNKKPIFTATGEQLAEWEEALITKNKVKIDEMSTKLKTEGMEIFDPNFFSLSVVRSIDNVKAGTMKQFVDALARSFAKTADDAPDGYVGLNLTAFKNEEEFLIKMGMENSRLRFHPAIAKRIEEFTGALYGDGATADAMAAYDRLQNLWKASVTSIFPAFHGRNAISNVFLNYNDIGLESLNPATHAMTAQMFKADWRINELQRAALKGGEEGAKAKDEIADIMLRKAFTDRSGHEWSFGELRDVMKKNNIALREDITGQVDVTRTPEEMINAIMPASLKEALNPLSKQGVTNPLSQNFKPFEYGRKVGNIIEGNARMVNFLTNLRKTGDVGLAVARTKQFLFDYQYLTPFERNVMRRILPFYSFTRKNLEAQVTTLLHAPGRTAAQLTALTTLSDVWSGGSLTDAEKEALPDWVKSGIGIVTKKDGKNVEITGSLGSPIEAIFSQAQPNVLLSSISPIPRLPVELASGYSFFQGKPLSDVTNASQYENAPQAIKDFIKYTEIPVTVNGETTMWRIALRPERMYLINNLPPTSRVLTTIKQMENEEVSDQNKLLQGLIGVRPFAFDLEKEAKKKEQALQNDIEKILIDARVGYKFDKFVESDQ